MDWIEGWFGWNPDGGDGSVEWLLIGGVIIAVLAAVSGMRPAVRDVLRRVLRSCRRAPAE